MNIPKKQMRVPSWLPTTVALMAIVVVILLIYVVVTIIDPGSAGLPTPTPQVTSTPIPTQGSDPVTHENPLLPVSSESPLYSKVATYLTSLEDNFSADSLTLSSLKLADTDTLLLYAKYLQGNTYKVTELLSSDSIRPVADADNSYTQFILDSRKSNAVASIYIQALISNFYSLRNHSDYQQLTEIISTKDEADARSIINRLEYIDSITVNSLSINALDSDTVDYVVFTTEEIRLVGINTAAPGLSEILITLGEDYRPLIFIGTTDSKADAGRRELKESPSFQSLAATVNAALNTALETDSDLKAAYDRMMK